VQPDGSTVKGFVCEPLALDGAREITAFGGWLAYLEHVADGVVLDAAELG